MIRKFCRIFCVVFLIGDFHSSLSQFGPNRINPLSPISSNASIASIDDAFHQASIRLIDQDGTFGEGHICSGSLISTRVVLTSARCLFNSSTKKARHPSEIKVVMGTPNRYKRTLDTIISRITHIRYPSSFDFETLRDDIGLLFLNRDVPEHHLKVRPIELDWKINEKCNRGSVTSWELTRNGDTSHQLLIANVSIVDKVNCVNKLSQPIFTSGMICGKYEGLNKEFCQSDAGAPLVHAGKQIGLASWTTSECWARDEDHYAVYSNVAHHGEWIRRELTDVNNTDSSLWGFLGFLTLTWLAVREKKKMSFRFYY